QVRDRQMGAGDPLIRRASRMNDANSPARTATAAPDVTRKLARFVVATRPENIPDKVRREARRALLNWLGCAIGGARHPAVDAAVFPAHCRAGWHITGTAGVFGAAAAAGVLLRLSEQQMTWAHGLAATQAAGLREMFGTMSKSLHPGRAAQNGLASAFLARA